MSTATKTKKQISTFKIKSTSNFIGFLKRFSAINTQLLLEMTATHIQAKSYTPDRAVVKFSRLKIEDVFEGTSPADLVKIGLHDINKIVNIFKYFDSGDEIFMDLRYDEINDETIGIEMVFRSSTLEVNVGCQDLALFPVFISADALKRIVKSVVDEKTMEFEFPSESYAKVKSLCSIDSAADLLRIKIKDNKVFFTGKSFRFELMELHGVEVQNLELAFKNEQFGYIDQEKATFHISPQKILVRSDADVSDTLIVLGRTE